MKTGLALTGEYGDAIDSQFSDGNGSKDRPSATEIVVRKILKTQNTIVGLYGLAEYLLASQSFRMQTGKDMQEEQADKLALESWNLTYQGVMGKVKQYAFDEVASGVSNEVVIKNLSDFFRRFFTYQEQVRDAIQKAGTSRFDLDESNSVAFIGNNGSTTTLLLPSYFEDPQDEVEADRTSLGLKMQELLSRKYGDSNKALWGLDLYRKTVGEQLTILNDRGALVHKSTIPQSDFYRLFVHMTRHHRNREDTTLTVERVLEDHLRFYREAIEVEGNMLYRLDANFRHWNDPEKTSKISILLPRSDHLPEMRSMRKGYENGKYSEPRKTQRLLGFIEKYKEYALHSIVNGNEPNVEAVTLLREADYLEGMLRTAEFKVLADEEQQA